MPSCAFDKCRNHSRKENKTHGITFHAFPQDELWCYKWLRVVRKQRQEPKWTCTSHSRVCSLHFKLEDLYTTDKGRKRITIGAVPIYKVPTSAKSSRSHSSHSSDSDNSKSSESIEEEPQNVFMKRKIEKIIADKKRVLQVNVNLKKQNKRLSQKCLCLKNIVIDLKEKIKELESRLENQNK